MASFSWLRRRPRAIAAAGVLTAITVTIGTLAFVYQGKPTTEVDLNDGGVWVTKKSALLVGHFNKQSAVIDSGLRAGSDGYDIGQQGSTVLVSDTQKSTLALVDPARVAMTDSAEVPGGAQVALGGGRVSIVDPSDGTTWVVDATALGSFAPATSEPVGQYGKDAVTAAASDGTVFVVSADTGTLATLGYASDRSPIESATRELPGISPTDRGRA
jgi:large repetitive protein